MRTICVLALAACSSSPPLVPADALTMAATIDSTGSGIAVSVSFTTTGDYDYGLAGGESLTATIGNTTMDVVDMLDDNLAIYQATFPADVGDSIDIALDRPDGEALMASASIPSRFEVTSVPDATSRAAGFTIDYTPVGHSDEFMFLLPTGDCLRPAQIVQFADTGSIAVGPGVITGDSHTCDVTIDIYRASSSPMESIDPAFAGGQIHAQEHRSLVLTSAP